MSWVKQKYSKMISKTSKSYLSIKEDIFKGFSHITQSFSFLIFFIRVRSNIFYLGL